MTHPTTISTRKAELRALASRLRSQLAEIDTAIRGCGAVPPFTTDERLTRVFLRLAERSI